MNTTQTMKASLERLGYIPEQMVDLYCEERDNVVNLVLSWEELESLKDMYYQDTTREKEFMGATVKIMVRSNTNSGVLIDTPSIIDIGSWEHAKAGGVFHYQIEKREYLDYLTVDFFIQSGNPQEPYKLLLVNGLKFKGFAKKDKQNNLSFVELVLNPNLESLFSVSVSVEKTPYVSIQGSESNLNVKEMMKENKNFFLMVIHRVAHKLTQFVVDFDYQNESTNQRTEWMQKFWRKVEMVNYKKAQAYMLAYRNGEAPLTDIEDRQKWIEDTANELCVELGVDEQILELWTDYQNKIEEFA